MKRYTEEQLKRAFEWGHSVGVGVAISKSSASAVLKEYENTPIDVHETNAALFLWQEASWDDARKWILNPKPPVMRGRLADLT